MFAAGDVLGDRYEIEGPLGQGGMAHVFAAHDRHLDRSVAVKVLRPHLTEIDAERLRREIRALARLSHPGIVSIFDLGQGDHVYFAMERIEGGPFTDLGPYEGDVASQERLLRAAIAVAETLGYVHRLGMVHRDLTPRNILLTARGDPKLMDFGLVQLTETSRELTRTGFTLGTPHYMAPEQATGDATGAATDLYAFGVVLYRAMTGAAAFDADNDQALRNVLRSARAAAPGRPAAGPSRTSVFPSGPAAPRELRERWRIRLEQGPQWPAGLAAAEGFLLAGLRSDVLAVLRPADGGVHARFELADEVEHPPTYAEGRVWIGSRDGGLAQIAWPEGRTVWRGDDVDAAGIAAVGDGLLVARRNGGLERWNDRREVVWRGELGAPAGTPPVLHRGEAVVLDVEGGLHAFDLADGRARFRADLAAAPAPAAAANGMLLLQERSGELHGFSLTGREVAWSYGLEGDTWSGPAVWERRVYAAGWSRVLHCLSLLTGDDVWSRELPGAVTASPVIASGVVWVVTESGELLGFDARSGEPRDRRQISHAPIQAPPLPFRDRLVVAATDGTVVAFD